MSEKNGLEQLAAYEASRYLPLQDVVLATMTLDELGVAGVARKSERSLAAGWLYDQAVRLDEDHKAEAAALEWAAVQVEGGAHDIEGLLVARQTVGELAAVQAAQRMRKTLKLVSDAMFMAAATGDTLHAFNKVFGADRFDHLIDVAIFIADRRTP
jgi:hypothetical protein